VNRPFRRTFEAAEDTGAAPDDGSLADLGEITFSDQSAMGRRMRDSVAAEDAPPPVEPPPAAEAPAPAAPAAPAEPAAPPADGDIAPPQQLWEQLEDGRIRLANGHEYATAEKAFEALWHAQNHISTGAHKQQPEQALPDPDEWDDEEDDEPEMLAGWGAPLGGEPSDVADLVRWAEQDVTAATQWALQNQTRVPAEVVNALYAAWHQEQPAAADNYVLQLQAQAARMEMDEREMRIQAMIQPLLEQQTKQAEAEYTAKLAQLPHWDHYYPRLQQLVGSDPELAQALAELSPADQFEEIYSLYARLRVDDSVRAQTAAAAAPAGVGSAAAAVAQAAPAPAAAEAPVVEGRGGRSEELPADDPIAIMRRGIAAFTNASDPFSGPPS